MHLNDYQKAAETLATYCGTMDEYRLQFLALGMAGEAGEFADRVKKLWRHGVPHPT